MSLRSQKLAALVPYWQELREKWYGWKEGEEAFALSAESTAYFVPLTSACFQLGLNALPGAERVPRLSDKETWQYVLRYFTVRRPKSKKFVIEDIFDNARVRAMAEGVDAQWDRLDLFLGWVINQFKMRVEEVAENYAGEGGVPSLRKRMRSGDEPLGAGDGGESGAAHSLWDLLAREEVLGSVVEEAEIRRLAERWAEVFFPGVRQEFRVTLMLWLLKVERGIKLPCTDPMVVRVTGRSASVLYGGFQKTREGWKVHQSEQPEYPELDGEARVYADACGWTRVMDQTENWFWSEKRMAALFPLLTPPE